ncbi:hypothetical protein BY996DRAFT_8456326 [Phakopsora pachyrhizi]|nr:hypothetical protein BY996DRAFT_8456326 [Phakopsora pachyrhizi]
MLLALQVWHPADLQAAHNLILSASKATEFASANPSHGVCQKIISNLEGHHSTQARKSLAEFLSAVKGKLEAVSPIRVWAKASIEQKFSSLKDTAKMANFTVGPDCELYPNFCYQDEHHAESACLLLEESYMIFCPPEPYMAVTLSDWEMFFSDKTTKIKNSIQFFAEDSARVFEQKMANESIKLLNVQKNLVMDVLRLYSSEGDSSRRSNEQMKKSFLDSITSNNGLSLPSLNKTIQQCIKLSLRKKADRLKVNFKVPDKHFWCVKMKALIGLRDWKSLEAWAGNKNPIVFEVYLFFLIK